MRSTTRLFQASFSASPAAWKGKHVLSTQQFNRDSLDTLFGLADYFKLMVKTGKPLPPYLEGKHLACVFMEPSTRTSSSFQSAMLRLGGTTLQINESGSSSEKGETLEDTIRCLESYADALVLRHPEKGAAARAAAVCHKAILNAGDGVGEHPTQALLDMYTIRSELMNGKKIFNSSDASGFEVMDGKTISLVGDLKNGRTVHSLATLLARNCPGVKLRLVSPPQLGLPQSVMNELKDSSMSCVSEHEDLDAVISSTDVLYMTRVQKERFVDLDEYERFKLNYVVTEDTMEKVKDEMVLMHPLPRVGEIDPAVDADPRSAFFRQMENGMYIRMSILALVLGAEGLPIHGQMPIIEELVA